MGNKLRGKKNRKEQKNEKSEKHEEFGQNRLKRKELQRKSEFSRPINEELRSKFTHQIDRPDLSLLY